MTQVIEPQQADFVPVKDQTYTLPWRYLSAAEHRVELRDQAELVARVLVRGVDYTISPQGDTPVGSGTLTLLATPTASEVKLVIAHDTTPDQNYRAVPGAEAIERQLDRFSHKFQQLDGRLKGNLSLVDRARRWAIERDFILVDDEDYSSKHYAGRSKASSNTAINAAEATAVDLFVDTKAEADAALAGLSEGDVVDIGADETRGDYRTRYRVESGALVFKIRLEAYREYESYSEIVLSDEPSRATGAIWKYADIVAQEVMADEDFTIASGVKLKILEDEISPRHFGWTESVADSLPYMQRCIRDGRPVDWGNYTYGFSSPIVETVSHPVAWRSQGAKFKYTGADASDCVALLVNAQIHSIIGILEIDADQKCQSGLRITNAANSLTAGVKPIFIGKDISVKNVRRHTLSLSHGFGISVFGAFRAVSLTRPSVTDCSLVQAARISGSAGMQSIVISRTADGDVEYAKITDPYIENNFMDESTDAFDQDGIVAFTRYLTADVAGVQNRATAIIEGGVIKNVRGRAIKIQGHNAQVNNLTIIKDSSVVGFTGIQASQREVEFQTGGGQVRDLTIYLDGTCSQDVVGVLGNAQVGKFVPGPIVSGVRGRISGVAPRSIVFVSDPTQGNRTGAVINDIIVDGPCESIVFHNATGTGNASLVGTNWIGSPTVQGFLTAGLNHTDALLTNIVNSGSNLVPLFTIASASGAAQDVRAVNCHNWSGGNPPLTTKTKSLANGETLSIPYSGFGGYAIIGCESAAAFQAILQLATNGSPPLVRVVDQAGTSWVVADSSEPATGSLRAWVSSGALQIKNLTGLTLRFNVLIVG